MSDKNLKDFRDEWVAGYEEAKTEGASLEYMLATIGISVVTIVATLLVLLLIVWLVKSVFWYVVGGFAYLAAAKIFGWPTPLDLIKKLKK